MVTRHRKSLIRLQGCLSIALAVLLWFAGGSRSAAGETFPRMVSQPGDFIGLGATYLFTPANSVFVVGGEPNDGISISVLGLTEWSVEWMRLSVLAAWLRRHPQLPVQHLAAPLRRTPSSSQRTRARAEPSSRRSTCSATCRPGLASARQRDSKRTRSRRRAATASQPKSRAFEPSTRPDSRSELPRCRPVLP